MLCFFNFKKLRIMHSVFKESLASFFRGATFLWCHGSVHVIENSVNYFR